MADRTCSIDGKPAHRRAKIGEGYWCHACYEWSRKRGGADPSQRTRHQTADPDRGCTIDGCGKPHKANGLCQSHYTMSYYRGDPEAERLRRYKHTIRQAMLEATAGASDDCMFFEGRQERHMVLFEGVAMNASRAAWMARNGHPDELHVLHACNGGSGEHGCINLRHLYLGTHAENMTDMVEAGNQGGLGQTWSQGEGNGNVLLTEAAVIEARAAWVKGSRFPHPGSTRALAIRFGVAQATMKDALTRRWAHVK